MAEADAGVPRVRCFWEYKFTSRANMKKVYQTERGWSRLGPTGSDRVEHAYENGHIGEEFFLTLAPMLAYRVRMVFVDSFGAVMVRAAMKAPVAYMVASCLDVQKTLFGGCDGRGKRGIRAGPHPGRQRDLQGHPG